jgi:hypothetical protein
MNERPMRRLGISRRQLFEVIERPLLRRLPATENVYAEWRLARVGLDYHVEVESFFYSVPHALIRQQVDLCITAHTIEVFHRGKRVAAHLRRYGGRRHGTDPRTCPVPIAGTPSGRRNASSAARDQETVKRIERRPLVSPRRNQSSRSSRISAVSSLHIDRDRRRL